MKSNNFEYGQRQNSFSKDFNSSIINLINKTKQIERKQMEHENKQQIPEHSEKLNIIEIIDSSRLNESLQLEKEKEQNNINTINEKKNNNIYNNYNINDNNNNIYNINSNNSNNSNNTNNSNNNHNINDINSNNNEIEEPMTFNPSRSNFFDNSKEENFNNNQSIHSTYNINECVIILKKINDKIYEEYENINNFINDIKIIEINNSDEEIVNLINSSIDQIKITRMKLIEYFEKSEKNLIELKDKYGSQITNKTEPTQNFENSILQFNNIELNELYLKNSTSSQNNNSYIQPMTTSMLKINNDFSERNYYNNDLIIQMNQIDEITQIYKGKIKAYEDKINHLNNKIKYFQDLLTNSKCLIDDLSNKNKLLTSKVIKYKQLSGKN